MNNLPAILPWVFWLSVLTFFGSLIALPLVIIRMPSDYFVRTGPSPDSWRASHPLIRIAFRFMKNVLGLIFLVAGLIMLFTPGQGILAALVGLSLLDIPGKQAWERRVVTHPRVYRVLNRIRLQAGRPRLQLPDIKPSVSSGQSGERSQG